MGVVINESLRSYFSLSKFFIFFFSTVVYNLENKKWGTKFPVIMNELYLDELNSSHIPEAINELRRIKQGRESD